MTVAIHKLAQVQLEMGPAQIETLGQAMDMVRQYRPDLAYIVERTPMTIKRFSHRSVIAQFSMSKKRFEISTLAFADPEYLAVSLVHEATHAVQVVLQHAPMYTKEIEVEAFHADLDFYKRLHPTPVPIKGRTVCQKDEEYLRQWDDADQLDARVRYMYRYLGEGQPWPCS